MNQFEEIDWKFSIFVPLGSKMTPLRRTRVNNKYQLFDNKLGVFLLNYKKRIKRPKIV